MGDIFLPVIWFIPAVLLLFVLVKRMMKNQVNYTFWDIVTFCTACFLEAFIFASWSADGLKVASFIAMSLAIYLAVQHRCHHAISCVTKDAYFNRMEVGDDLRQWTSNCVKATFLGQFLWIRKEHYALVRRSDSSVSDVMPQMPQM